MWDLAVREEDYKSVDAMLQRYPAKAPLSKRILPAIARRDAAMTASLREELRSLDARQSQIAARYVATFLEDAGTAEELARLDLQPRRNAAIRLGAQTFLAWLEIARGRWTAASSAFDEAARMDGGSEVLTDRAIAAVLPFMEVPHPDLQRIRQDIEAWQPASEVVRGSVGLGPALRPHLRLYILGLLSSRLGESERAARYAQELARLAAPEQARNVILGLVGTVRADVALRAGRAADALTLLRPANGEVPLELVFVKPFVNVSEFTQEHARYLRAEALLSLGRNEEARRWLETSFQGSPSELVYLAPTHFRLGQIHERQGDRARASVHYQRFVRLWRDSDPVLQSRVKEAEAALNRAGPR
jgi:tetratricopeptide (TPR) repeat protein